MKLFISYHLADSKSVSKIKEKLDNRGIKYYSVPENTIFKGIHNEEISKTILSYMRSCEILLCIVGKETYKRPHVDYEIHEALKGEAGKRKGVIVVLLDNREDTINEIDKQTYPRRLGMNKDYTVLVQNSSLFDNINGLIKQAKTNRNNKKLIVNNTMPCMKLPNKYYGL